MRSFETTKLLFINAEKINGVGFPENVTMLTPYIQAQTDFCLLIINLRFLVRQINIVTITRRNRNTALILTSLDSFFLISSIACFTTFMGSPNDSICGISPVCLLKSVLTDFFCGLHFIIE